MPSSEPHGTESDPANCETLVELVRLRARLAPDGLAYAFLEDGEDEAGRLTFRDLDGLARAIAATLQERAESGDHVLLLYPPGLDYVAAFFGCLYAGCVPVPAYPPRPNRSVERLRSILADSGASLTLTTRGVLADPRLHALAWGGCEWICTDGVASAPADEWSGPALVGDASALLQYTSGATGSPKGVMLSHANLLANEQMIERALGHTEASTFVSWLPIYHDMGLIGSLLQPLYVGAACVFMSPTAFLQKPVRWLRAIGAYGAHTSGAPNFAYDLCVERIGTEERDSLDLSSWRVAFNGAEPVRTKTLERFAEAFGPCGFRREAFWPCYGLAEATLLVSGGGPVAPPVVGRFDSEALRFGHATDPRPDGAGAQALVGCGQPMTGLEIAVVDPETGVGCAQDGIGEIWLRGPSVARGYWNPSADSQAVFEGHRADTGEGPYLRTGDLGFQREGELFLTGRLKDLIIVRGRNHYPQDVEDTVEGCHPTLRPGGAVACGVDTGGAERVVVFAEVERRHHRNFDRESVVAAVRSAVAEEHELHVHALLLLRPGGLPRTSSGKKQRHTCRDWFLAGSVESLAEWSDPLIRPGEASGPDSATAPADVAELEDWLAAILAAELSASPEVMGRHELLANHGVDSIAATTLCYRIESTLGVAVSIGDVVGGTLSEVAAHVWAACSEPHAPTGPVPGDATVTEGPASQGQQALWFLHQVAPDSAAYTIARAVRVAGEIDAPALRRALETLVRRHDVLATSFYVHDGHPWQRIHPHRSASWQEIDSRGWDTPTLGNELDRAAGLPFDLRLDPLLRLTLFRRSPADDVLLVCVHHIVADLWSLTLVMHELGVLYAAEHQGEAAALPPSPLRYMDYARWEAEMLAGPRGLRLSAFWEEHLAGGFPPLDLPLDRLPPSGGGPRRGATERFRLGRATSASVRTLAQTCGATLYMTHLAALQALIYRYTGQARFVVGSLTHGRSHASLAGLVGYLVNPLALRADVTGSEPFSILLRRTRDRVRDALRHQDYPFSLVVEALRPNRSAGRPQLLQVMFVFQRLHLLDQEGLTRFALGESGARMDWGGLSLESLELDRATAQFDLTLTVAEADGETRGSLDYCADIFDRETARRILDHLRSILAGAAADPEIRIDDLPLARKPESGGIVPDAGASW